MKHRILKKTLVIGVIFLFFGAGAVSSISGDIERMNRLMDMEDYIVSNESNTVTTGLDIGAIGTRAIIYVDDDADPGWYNATHVKTIQEGVNNASTYDTVFVYNGTYNENVLVDKSVDLIGDDKNTTIINSVQSGAVVEITADQVNISGFTMQSSYQWFGIAVRSDNNVITGNIVKNVDYTGIYLESASNNVISENTIDGSAFKNMAPANRAVSNGISLETSCNNNIIQGNTILHQSNRGIFLASVFSGSSSNDNSIQGNTLDNNRYGIYISVGADGFNNNTIISENNITNTVYYGICLSVALSSATNTDTVISKNMINDSESGIYIDVKDALNTNTIISQNTITETNYGIRMFTMLSPTVNEGTVSENQLKNNGYGVYLEGTDNNILLYHNNFIGNIQHAFDNGMNNQWNDSYPSGGNYWDDYDGSDDYHGPGQNISGSDGIGDTSYNISGDGNQDHYPLMNPWRYCKADFDRDNDVDLSDYAKFQGCYAGAGNPPACPQETNPDMWDSGFCKADFDQDNDVDLSDYAKFQGCYAGAGNPPACPQETNPDMWE